MCYVSVYMDGNGNRPFAVHEVSDNLFARYVDNLAVVLCATEWHSIYLEDGSKFWITVERDQNAIPRK